jgi:hypothetical protein
MIIKREYHCITDHKIHDWNATKVFFDMIDKDMAQYGNFTWRREMTDGANDFKSKSPLTSVGLAWLHNNMGRETNQTLPGKGKGECDRTGGHFGAFVKLIMKMVDDRDRVGVIRPQCAKDLCDLLRTQSTFLLPVHHPGMTVFKHLLYADESDFPDPDDVIQGLTTFSGSRSNFCYITPAENKEIDWTEALWRGKGKVDILYRRLTCGCDMCGDGVYERCLRKSSVGEVQRCANLLYLHCCFSCVTMIKRLSLCGWCKDCVYV